MVKAILYSVFAFMIFLFSFGTAAFSQTTEECVFVPLDLQVKQLLKEPVEGSGSAFDIPIGVKITGMTSDGNWYKAKISYDFLGHYEYEGWIRTR